jgi:hypothetical protein
LPETRSPVQAEYLIVRFAFDLLLAHVERFFELPVDEEISAVGVLEQH